MLLGWFTPKCPLETREQAWIEGRMAWLADQFGLERMTRSALVLPGEGFVSGPQEQTPEAARQLMERVGGHLGVDVSKIALEVLGDEEICGGMGPDEPGRIRIGESLLGEPLTLVAALAHELGRELLRCRRLLEDAMDREWVADLTPVFFGLGLFSAGATLRERCEHGLRTCSSAVGKQAYLPSRMVGYALALFAHGRGERKPAWNRYLRLDAADTFRAGLRYLESRQEETLLAGFLGARASSRSLSALLDEVERGEPAAAVGAMWELVERGPAADEAVEPVRNRLASAIPALRAEAARALGVMGPAAEPAVDDLLELLRDPFDEVRAAAAYALGRLALHAEEVLPILADRLADSCQRVGMAAAMALADFGRTAQSVLPNLVEALERAVMTTEYAMANCLLQAVERISDDPEQTIRELVNSLDPESQHHALAVLSERTPIDRARAPGAWFGSF